jgi:hypothetical protein
LRLIDFCILGNRYEEQVTEALVLKMALSNILFEGESQYQRIQVINSGSRFLSARYLCTAGLPYAPTRDNPEHWEHTPSILNLKP